MEIRLATPGDIEALCPLLTEFFAYNAGLQPAYCRAQSGCGEYPKKMIENEDSDFLVAVECGAVLGFLHINQMKTPPHDSLVPHAYAEIMAFMVSAPRRGEGIGAMLIDAAKQWSRARNLDYIELFSLVNAEEAGRFYDHENFDTVGQIRRYPLTKL